jgi:Na+/H+-dicarboxylate symporter
MKGLGMAVSPTHSKSGAEKLAVYIVIAMLIGIVFGWLVNQQLLAIDMSYVSLLSTLFLRAIKMIIAPLVFSTLVIGIAHMGNAGGIGRVGLKALAWFFTASLVSLFLGLVFANIFAPGVGAGLGPPSADQIAASQMRLDSFQSGVHDAGFVAFISNQLIPTSIIHAAGGNALGENKLLQIVVFSLFFGVALGSLGKAGKVLQDGIEQLSHVMIKITGYVMYFAPLAVFAAMSNAVANQGLGILFIYFKFMSSFYMALLVLWLVLVAIGYFFLGKRILRLLHEIKEAFFLSFATASSEAAYPKILDALDRFGVSRKISSFVMPLGYSFNLDGSMMYCAFASLFIAQVYGMDMTLGTQIAMLLTLMVTSKGMAGIPSASLVVIAGTLAQFGLPVEGMVLILGIDRFLDMGRSATNAVGNSIASAVIGKWEGELLSESEAEMRRTTTNAD